MPQRQNSTAGESWVITVCLRTDHGVAEVFSQALGDHTDAQMAYEVEEDVWAARAYAGQRPDLATIQASVAIVAASLAIDVPAVTLEKLPPTDWVAHVYEGFQPLQLGRFYIFGSHLDQSPPRHSWSMKIDAATAFGTGDHGSTSGCLLALDTLVKRRRPRRVLDVGTGTGILAMAAVRAGAEYAVAVDIDPQAVAVAALNVRINGLARSIRTGVANGTASRIIGPCRPYDIVFANILAGPLVAMSRNIAREVAPGGNLILAGLLNRQAMRVITAYRRQGLSLDHRVERGIWTTLVLNRKS